jgi:hypothetical protein
MIFATTLCITSTHPKVVGDGSENYRNIIINIILGVKKLASASALPFGI